MTTPALAFASVSSVFKKQPMPRRHQTREPYAEATWPLLSHHGAVVAAEVKCETTGGSHQRQPAT